MKLNIYQTLLLYSASFIMGYLLGETHASIKYLESDKELIDVKYDMIQKSLTRLDSVQCAHSINDLMNLYKITK